MLSIVSFIASLNHHVLRNASNNWYPNLLSNQTTWAFWMSWKAFPSNNIRQEDECRKWSLLFWRWVCKRRRRKNWSQKLLQLQLLIGKCFNEQYPRWMLSYWNCMKVIGAELACRCSMFIVVYLVYFFGGGSVNRCLVLRGAGCFGNRIFASH